MEVIFMGMPTIPDIDSKIKVDIDIDFEGVIKTTILSIALEELGLAHIINAEGEKLQCFLGEECKVHCLDDALKLNEDVRRTLQTVIKQEMLLQFKLENLMDLDDKHKCHKK
jgi:adenylate kinase